MVDLESSSASPSSPTPGNATARPRQADGVAVTLVSDDRALAERLAAELLVFELALGVIPLTGQAERGPWRLVGDDPLLVDLSPRPDPGLARALAAIERARLGGVQRLVVALGDPADAAPVQRALDAGADDFCLRSAPGWEVYMRLSRLMAQRAPSADDAVLAVGDLELDPRTRSVRRRGQRLALPSRQFELLRVLMRHPGEPLSQARLLAELGLSQNALARGSNLIEVHVHQLRRQIGDGRLSTVRGRGYVLHPLADIGT